MLSFVGRSRELARLGQELDRTGPDGRLLVVRGRRQVGKSTLLERFLASDEVPSAFVTAAAGATPDTALLDAVAEVSASSLQVADVVRDARPATWDALFRLLARSTTQPSVLVIDELPYLLASDPSLEGVLQRAWDRELSRSPVLLVLIGSDVSTMELLTTHGRPLFGRGGELRVDALGPADLRELLDLDAASAFDATVVTGGLPRLAQEWQASGAADPMGFVATQLQDPTSPLVVLGERYLSAEFPSHVQAGEVLQVVGAGEPTFQRIAERAGINHGSLTRSLRTLTDARLVVTDRPLSMAPTRLVHHHVRDPYLRFWLRFVGPNRDRIDRGRGDVVAQRIATSWSTYRGTAVQPLIAEALARLLPDARLGEGVEVGRFWTRDHSVEVDLVIAGKDVPPAAPTALGSIKWRENTPLTGADVGVLAKARASVPGAADASLFGVSRAGGVPERHFTVLRPEDLLR